MAPGVEHGGGDAVRPYTPVSSNDMVGKFQLVVKVYREWGRPQHPETYKPPGAVSNYINSLDIGQTVAFKHIIFNVKYPYPFTGVNTITMLCVGSGIAPMVQALRKLLFTEGDNTRIKLIYGNRTVRDILMRELVEEWAKEYAHRFSIVYCVGSKLSKAMRLTMGGNPGQGRAGRLRKMGRSRLP
jgi:cytochrome-b5 reductase